jgi:hypothetical protein
MWPFKRRKPTQVFDTRIILPAPQIKGATVADAAKGLSNLAKALHKYGEVATKHKQS